jgi:hypothetical protein
LNHEKGVPFTGNIKVRSLDGFGEVIEIDILKDQARFNLLSLQIGLKTFDPRLNFFLGSQFHSVSFTIAFIRLAGTTSKVLSSG